MVVIVKSGCAVAILAKLFVDDVLAKAGAGALQLGDEVADLEREFC